MRSTSAYDRVREIERSIVTPAMKRIEAEDPERRLAGLEHSLKGKDRLTEKVDNWMSAQADLTAVQAIGLVKDAIRYTFVYPTKRLTRQACRRTATDLSHQGSRPLIGRIPGRPINIRESTADGGTRDSGMLFEVQFHTQESLDAKELTHPAYERIRDTKTPPDEVRRA